MGEPVYYDKKFAFIVEIDGVGWAGFTTCSEIAGEFEDVNHREGGRRHPHKAPGLVDFPDVTLTRGSTEDFDLYNWFKECYDAAAGTGQAPPDLYRTVDVVQLDEEGEELRRYRLYKAYCKRWSSGDWDNNASEALMESVVIRYDYPEKVPS